MTLREYRAMIDVSMGGRIAEELSAFFCVCLPYISRAHPRAVYGPESVTSGCSSDLQQATNVAKAMVRVRIKSAQCAWKDRLHEDHRTSACPILLGRFTITHKTRA